MALLYGTGELMALATGDLAAVAAECLCGWRGKASEGVLRRGCDVALPPEIVEKVRQAAGALRKLQQEHAWTLWRHSPVRRAHEAYLRAAAEASEKTFVWCPHCDHTATFAGSKFEPIEVG